MPYEDDEQLPLGGLPWVVQEADPDSPPPFDEWEQQIDETDAEYALRMDRARAISEGREWADPVSTPLEDIETFRDLIDPTRQAEVDGYDAWKCACGWAGMIAEMKINATGSRVCPGCGGSGSLLQAKNAPQPGESYDNYNKRVLPPSPAPVVTACPVPSAPMTVEALQAMAAAALAVIEEKKRAARPPAPVVEPPYVQESFVSNECTAKGGTGDDCMMCNGSACRWCGFGCWSPDLPKCRHNETERHNWDPDIKADKRDEMEQFYIRIGIREDRRKEMLDLIFAGEPDRPGSVTCLKCGQKVRMGEAVWVTTEGSQHMKDCTGVEEEG